MTDAELDALLDGARGATLTLSTPDGPVRVYLDRHALESPVAWRAAMRRGLGHLGYEPPAYDREDHDHIVRVMFAFADRMATATST